MPAGNINRIGEAETGHTGEWADVLGSTARQIGAADTLLWEGTVPIAWGTEQASE